MQRRSDVARPLTALLVAEAVSTTGSEMAAIALPWFVLVTTGSPGQMGMVMAAEFLGMTLLGIPSGRVASSLGARRTLLLSDASRAGLVALVPILHWSDRLSLPVLLAVGLAVGAFFPAYSSSQLIVVADLLGDDELRTSRVSGIFGSVNETASFIGPAIGGVLVALMGAVGVIVVNAASYVAAFVLVLALVPRGPRSPPEPVERGWLDGLRDVLRARRLRWQVGGLAVVEIGFTAMLATLPVAALERYGGGARLAGWLLAAYGAGSVAGGLISARTRRVSDRAATVAILALAVTTWPLVFDLPAWAVAVAVAANGVCSGLFFPRFFSALTVRTPAPQRAGVMTAVNTLMSCTGPIGLAGGGLLLHATSSVTAGFVLVAVATTAGSVIVAAGSGFGLARARAAPAGTERSR